MMRLHLRKISTFAIEIMAVILIFYYAPIFVV